MNIELFKKFIKKHIPKKAFKLAEPVYHFIKAGFFVIKNGYPGRNMNIIGVTGTNGKTSTSFMIHKILVESGVRTGLMTTVAYGVDHDIVDQEGHVTTVPAAILQKRLAEFKKKGVEWVVVEVTSHALAQYRTLGLPFKMGVLTNITHEHLDYHGSFDRYIEAKKRLFNIVASNNGVSVINADDEVSSKLIDRIPNVISYGLNSGDVRASVISQTGSGSVYKASLNNKPVELKCNIPGEFNILNSLAAAVVASSIGLSGEQIKHGLGKLDQIEGRMNKIDCGQDFSAIIDFAHTPDSFERLLSSMRNSTKGKLVVVFGSAGRRDEAKRAIQGEIAGRYADEVVLTEEDDRDVEGLGIMRQIAEGAERSGKRGGLDMFLILNRVEAIRFAVGRVAGVNDTVVFLGKGHEKTIERADGEYAWDEAKEVRTAISLSLD